MLTTASITLSATSAIRSGPRAALGGAKKGRPATAAANAANAGRRKRRAEPRNPGMEFNPPVRNLAATLHR